LELQSGVSGVANILAGKGYEIDPCLVPALILLLGASDFANVMDILGSPIDKQNFEASLGSIQRNQGDLGRMSQQARDKISAGNTGKVMSQAMSQQSRDKISAGNTGKVMSQQTRDKISAGNTGKVMSQQARDKITAGNTGKVRSQQVRDRQSESYKRNFQAKQDKARAEGKLIPSIFH
jgi:hypothetical protein